MNRRSALMVAALAAWMPGAEPDDGGVVIEAGPGTVIEDGFIAVYPNGFAARSGELVLIGDALRHDLRRSQLYAEGKVVLVLPHLRIHAARLGVDLESQRGEAWKVRTWIETGDGLLPVSAGHISFSREEIVFTDLQGGPRHGGIIGVSASSLRIRLRADPAMDRQPPARFVRDVTLYGPRIDLFGIPILWLPVLFRDYTLDYPWTRFRFGDSTRLGLWLRAQIATSLPVMFGWSSRIEGRYDTYSRTGHGLGVLASWKHTGLGRGRFLWFGMDEDLVSIDDPTVELGGAHQTVTDIDQRLAIPGGALSARWTALPDADPPTPGVLIPPSRDRFRHDYLREDLQHLPFARQGAAMAWGLPLGTLVLDTERGPNEDWGITERIVGLETVLPQTRLLGPLHIGADGWLERLENPVLDSQAWRLNADAGANALVWLGGLGLDAGTGAHFLLYDDRVTTGVVGEGAESRLVPYTFSGIRLRMEAQSGPWRHSLTPRIGLEILGEGQGDTLNAYGFGDPRDALDEDHQYVVTSLETSILRGSSVFRAEVAARWAIRDEDRYAVSSDGALSRGLGPLAEITAKAIGRPIQPLSIHLDLAWDQRTDEWRTFDTGITWAIRPGAEVRYDGTYNAQPGVTDPWEHRPGGTFEAGRYRLDTRVSLRPGGDDIDGWGVDLLRRAVDGRMGVSYELVRDGDGDITDRRVGFLLTFP